MFSYLRGYTLRGADPATRSPSVEGKTVNLEAIAYEKGGVTTPLEERPAIRYVEKVVSGLGSTRTRPRPRRACRTGGCRSPVPSAEHEVSVCAMSDEMMRRATQAPGGASQR